MAGRKGGGKGKIMSSPKDKKNAKDKAAMKKLTAADPETRSPDLVRENIEKLKELFPEIITEGPDGTAVNMDVLKALHPAGDTTCVFRDSAFADDVAKTNLTAILQQYGLETVRSL